MIVEGLFWLESHIFGNGKGKKDVITLIDVGNAGLLTIVSLKHDVVFPTDGVFHARFEIKPKTVTRGVVLNLEKAWVGEAMRKDGSLKELDRL